MNLCPEGYYCPEGTAFDWQPCPIGTFNNETGLAREDQCKPCLGGYYCDDYAATEPEGLCDPGYFCEYGSDRARPTGGNATVEINGVCQLSGMQ